jgi:hypothetical protein
MQEFSKVTFLKVDIDEAKDLTNYYAVAAIPHLKFLRAGKGGKIDVLSCITGSNMPQIKSALIKYGS